MQTTSIRPSLQHVSRRVLIVLCALACFGLRALPVHAQQENGPALQLTSPDKLFNASISLDAKKTTLLQVLDLMMKQANINYTLDSRLQDTGIGAVRLQKVPFRVALETVIKASNSPTTYRIENNIVMIIPRDETVQETALTQAESRSRLVTVVLDKSNLYQALKLIFMQARVNCELSTTLKNTPITVSLHDVPFPRALEAVLHASPTPLTYAVENDVYRIVTP